MFDFICTKLFAGHSHRSAPGKTMALLKLLSWNPVSGMKTNAVVQQVIFRHPRMFHDFPSDGVFKARSDPKLVRAPSDTDIEKRASPRERLRVQTRGSFMNQTIVIDFVCTICIKEPAVLSVLSRASAVHPGF